MSEATLPLQAAAPPRFSEDLVAVGLGLVVFLLALGSLAGADALGWLVTTSVWTDPSTRACARLESLREPRRRGLATR